MADLNEINTFATKYIVPGVVDNAFKNDPLLAYLKSNTLETFGGGVEIQENFLYGKMKGGSYAKGGRFDVTRRQTAMGANFDPKYYYVNVTEFLEDLEVEIRGDQAVFSLLDADIGNAALTMSGILAVALYNGGTRAGRTTEINGLAEAVNDGSANSWDGETYTTYGDRTRSGTIGSALNSVPNNLAGAAITYPYLEQKYSVACIGNEEPNLGITSNLGLVYVKSRFQPQQRLTEKDPVIGWRGLRFNSALIMKSQYCPGTEGVNDADLGNYLTTAGEVLWFLNTNYWRFWVSKSARYAFGFTGFKPGRDDTVVSGQYTVMCNVTCQSPRLQVQIYGIGG
jgi:hypothetical protein